MIFIMQQLQPLSSHGKDPERRSKESQKMLVENSTITLKWQVYDDFNLL